MSNTTASRQATLALAVFAAGLAAGPSAADPGGVNPLATRSVDYEELYNAKAAMAVAAERIAALGITVIESDDGTFVYGVPAGLNTPEKRYENGVTWRYDGQARFSNAAPGHGPVLIRGNGEPAEQELPDQLIGSISVDLYGRRWVAEAVDEKAVAAAVERYDALVEKVHGAEPVDPLATEAEASAEAEAAVEPEGWGVYEPHSWTRTDCDGDGDDDIRRWNSDNRNLSSTPMTARQEKVVLLYLYAGGKTAQCSGTMVDDEWLLTAAHCVTNSSGDFYSTWSMRACTHGNLDSHDSGSGDTATCHWASFAAKPGAYSGTGDMSDDYAVIRLATKPTSIGWMAISSASNSTIRSADSYKSAYPSYRPGCVANSAAGEVSGVTGKYQYWNKGDLFGTTSKRIKTRLDSGPGESGAPYYYYPGGCCGSHYLTGVHSGHRNLAVGSDYNGGPKGRAIRSWVATNTP